MTATTHGSVSCKANGQTVPSRPATRMRQWSSRRESASDPDTANTSTPKGSQTQVLDQSCLAHLLGYQIARADIPARKAFAHNIGKPLSLTTVEFSTLVLLAFNPGATPKQIAEALAMHAPAVTVLLDRLEQRRLLERVRSDSDRRAQHVNLTHAGTELAHKVHAVSANMERQLLARLSVGERAILTELLQKVSKATTP